MDLIVKIKRFIKSKNNIVSFISFNKEMKSIGLTKNQINELKNKILPEMYNIRIVDKTYYFEEKK